MENKKENWKSKNIPKIRTQYRRNYQASPFFEFSSPVITAGASWLIDIGEQDTTSKKYLPLSNVRIVNNSNENIAFYPNQKSEGLNIPAGTILNLDKASIGAIYFLKFTNLGSSSTTADQIKVTSWREGVEVDDAFRRMHEAFFNKFMGYR